MGLMDALKNPEIWQYIGGVGSAINNAQGGRPFDMSQANAGLAQHVQDRRKQAQLRGLMDQMDLTPAQRQLVGLMPADAAMGVLAERQFAQGGNDYGLNIVWGRDADGNYVPMQARKSGGLSAAPLPEGVSPVAPYNYTPVDTGTGTLFVDPRNPGGAAIPAPAAGGSAGPVPVAPAGGGGAYVEKNLEEAEAAKGRGRASAEEDAAKRARAVKAAEGLQAIDRLISDPYLPDMVGWYGGRSPDLSEDAARVVTKMEQVTGVAFQDAFESLKGGGQITELEGKAATQAITRLRSDHARLMNYEDYKDALLELRTIMSNAMRRERGEEVEEYISPFIKFAGIELSQEDQQAILALPPGQRLEIEGKTYVWDGRVLTPE